MLDGDRVEVILSLETTGVIRGTVGAAQGADQFFYGWLELAGAIDRARRVGATALASGPVRVELRGPASTEDVGLQAPASRVEPGETGLEEINPV